MLLSIACAGWIILAALIGSFPQLCGRWSWGSMTWAVGAVFVPANPNPLALQITLWSVMLLAQAPPLLSTPVRRVWKSNLRRHRVPALAAFVLGYALTWSALGPMFIVLAAGATTFFGRAVAPLLLLVALVWQVLPPKQAALKYCHSAPFLRTFGAVCLWDAGVYGALLGLSCFAACGPLMLAEPFAGPLHFACMVGVAAFLTWERHNSREMGFHGW